SSSYTSLFPNPSYSISFNGMIRDRVGKSDDAIKSFFAENMRPATLRPGFLFESLPSRLFVPGLRLEEVINDGSILSKYVPLTFKDVNFEGIQVEGPTGIETIPYNDLDGKRYISFQAVFQSWGSQRAVEYRRLNNLPNTGTAVTIQRMVFGNMGPQSGTAVVFSSDPATGEPTIVGDYMLGRQGESVVNSTEKPHSIAELKTKRPATFARIERLARTIEDARGAPQDIEMTWEDERRVYVLQTRDAKLSPTGKLLCALNSYDRNAIDHKALFDKFTAQDIEALTTTTVLNVPAGTKPWAKGSSATPGIVTGVLRTKSSYNNGAKYPGEKNIYCAVNTTPNDIKIIQDCDAIITSQGGAFSHAAIVGMSMGKIVVAGCEDLNPHDDCVHHKSDMNNVCHKTGTVLTVDGYTGNIYFGVMPKTQGRGSPIVQRLHAIAHDVVKGLPIINELQHLDDITAYPDIASHDNIYLLDFDCLSVQLNAAKSTWSSLVRERAENAFEISRKSLDHLPILKAEGRYVAQAPSSPTATMALWQEYIGAFASAAHKDGRHVKVIGTQSPKGALKIDNVEYVHPENYDNGINCVIIRPWAIEESYVEAARRRPSCPT
ncbi:MAG: Pyruvate phosphate dikinase, partial [Candidatus Peribacteria bacterium GW2011_GWB1_54_5]